MIKLVYRKNVFIIYVIFYIRGNANAMFKTIDQRQEKTKRQIDAFFPPKNLTDHRLIAFYLILFYLDK